MTQASQKLTEKRCIPCEGGTQPLAGADAQALMKQLDGRWKLVGDGKKLEASFDCKNYFRTMALVNAIAWVAHQEDHHPDISFGYNKVNVSYWTHTINGLSQNDFICAAKIDQLFK